MSEPVYLEPSRRVLFVEAIIPQNQALTPAVLLRSYELKGVIIPPDWTAASLTLQASRAETGTFVNVFDDAGAEVTFTVASDRYVVLGAQVEKAAGVEFLKLRSGTAAAPVNQTGANKTLVLVLGASTK